jgi:pyridoxamine 5'-phosphate oxidase
VDPVDRALLEADVDPDPIAQFRRWYAEAEAHTVDQPDAMVVATAAPGGEPDARVVLLRGIDERGFSFFTNFESRKGRDLRASPRAAALFHWRELGRQVRAKGAVEPVADVAADAYWSQRPRASRISAWASAQSEVISSREELDRRAAAIAARFGPDGDVPRPPHWGGYRIVVEELELWQHREHRLHDRLHYVHAADGSWSIERLQP